MSKIKNNRDLFALRGDPWEGNLPKRQSRLGPDGNLSLPRSAHILEILEPSVKIPAVPHGDHCHENECEACEGDPDMDQFSADHCIPIEIRLRKEKNTLLKSMSASLSAAMTKNIRTGPSSSSVDRLLVNSRAKLNRMRTSKIVKVK